MNNNNIIIKEISSNIIEGKIEITSEKKSEKKSSSKSINGKTVYKESRSLPYSPKSSQGTKLKRFNAKWLGADDVDDPVIDLSTKVESKWSEFRKNQDPYESLMNKNNSHTPLSIVVGGIKRSYVIVEGEQNDFIPHPEDENKNLMLIPTHTTDITKLL